MATVDFNCPDLWDDLRQQSFDLVTAYLAACQQPGEPGPAAAWRMLMTDIRDAVAEAGDGDLLSAVSALEEALLDTDEGDGILRIRR